MEAAVQTMELQIRQMTPVAAPPEQQAQVTALFNAMVAMAQAHRRRASWR